MKKETSFYDQMVAIDVIDPVLEAWIQGRISLPMDTKKFKLEQEIGINRTWTFATVCQDRKCAKWLGIYHKFYKILPPPCKQCWKVVYAPQSITELIDMQKVQAKMGLPAKCGTEQRDYTSGLGGYRAFWYCPFFAGLKGGRAHFEQVKAGLSRHFTEELIEARQTNGQFFLKRGCTELERDFGTSEDWDKIDHSPKFNLLEAVWEDPNEMQTEWPPLIYTNVKRWIEYAVAHNDLDALNYVIAGDNVEDKCLGVPAIKYQESEHKDDQFPLYMNPLNGSDQKKKETPEDGKEEPASPKADLFGFESAEGQKNQST